MGEVLSVAKMSKSEYGKHIASYEAKETPSNKAVIQT